MDIGFWLVIVLVIFNIILTFKMFDHIALNYPKKRGTWLLLFIFTGSLASYYYYFAIKRPMDLEKKKFSSSKK